MDCKKAEWHIFRLDHSNMDAGMDDSLRRHLDTCSECMGIYTLFRELAEKDVYAPRREKEPDWDRFPSMIRNRLIHEAYGKGRRYRIALTADLANLFRPVLRFGLAAAALAVLMILVSPFLPGSKTTSPSKSSVGAPAAPVTTASTGTFISFPFEDQISVPLETMSEEELQYLSKSLVGRLIQQDLAGARGSAPRTVNFGALKDDMKSIDAALSEMGSSELEHVESRLERTSGK